jgi:hypothetical protein
VTLIHHATVRAIYTADPAWDRGTRVFAVWFALNTGIDYKINADNTRSEFLQQFFRLGKREVAGRAAALSRTGWVENQRQRRADAKRSWLKKAAEIKTLKIKARANTELVWDQFQREGFMTLPDSRKLVLLCLAAHTNTDTGLSYPSWKRIAKLTGLSQNTVELALAALETAGCIQHTLQGRKDIYTVTKQLTPLPSSVSDLEPTHAAVTPVPMPPERTVRGPRSVSPHHVHGFGRQPVATVSVHDLVNDAVHKVEALGGSCSPQDTSLIADWLSERMLRYTADDDWLGVAFPTWLDGLAALPSRGRIGGGFRVWANTHIHVIEPPATCNSTSSTSTCCSTRAAPSPL